MPKQYTIIIPTITIKTLTQIIFVKTKRNKIFWKKTKTYIFYDKKANGAENDADEIVVTEVGNSKNEKLSTYLQEKVVREYLYT